MATMKKRKSLNRICRTATHSLVCSTLIAAAPEAGALEADAEALLAAAPAAGSAEAAPERRCRPPGGAVPVASNTDHGAGHPRRSRVLAVPGAALHLAPELPVL